MSETQSHTAEDCLFVCVCVCVCVCLYVCECVCACDFSETYRKTDKSTFRSDCLASLVHAPICNTIIKKDAAVIRGTRCLLVRSTREATAEHSIEGTP